MEAEPITVGARDLDFGAGSRRRQTAAPLAERRLSIEIDSHRRQRTPLLTRGGAKSESDRLRRPASRGTQAMPRMSKESAKNSAKGQTKLALLGARALFTPEARDSARATARRADHVTKDRWRKEAAVLHQHGRHGGFIFDVTGRGRLTFRPKDIFPAWTGVVASVTLVC